MVHGRGRCRATAAGGARHGFSSCVHSTRVVFNPSKVKIRVRVPMDAKPVIFFSPSFPRDEWIFGIPYTMVVNLRLDGRAVQGAGFRHQSLRRRGFESHSNQSTFFLFINQRQNLILALAQHERAGTVPPCSVGRAQDSYSCGRGFESHGGSTFLLCAKKLIIFFFPKTKTAKIPRPGIEPGSGG